MSKGWTGFGLIVLGLLMVILKVTGWLDWSWWLVFLPFYFPFAFAIGFILLLLIGGAIALFLLCVIGIIVGICEWIAER